MRGLISNFLRSLSFRLTIYSSLLNFAILIACWFALYISVSRSLSRQNEIVIKDRLQIVQSLLQEEGPSHERLIRRVEKEWTHRQSDRIFVKVINDQGENIAETPGLPLQETFPNNELSFGEIRILQRDSASYEAGLFHLLVPNAGSKASYAVQIILERTSEDHILGILTHFLYFLLSFGLIGSVWAARVTVRKALGPIRRISSHAKKVNSTSLQKRLEVDRLPIEFVEITQTLNQMLDRLQESFDRLTRFSGDMAHELRTPLNNLLGSFEVALSKERTPEAYRNVIESGMEECQRLKRIIESLLFVARAADPAREVPKQTLDLGEELRTILSFYEASAEEAGLDFKLDIAEGTALKAERELFQRAVGNLLSNSIRHSPPGAKIYVSAHAHNSQTTVVQVQDEGSGIPKNLLPHLGRRYGLPVMPVGSGFGLSIVKSIVEIHGGHMDAISEPGRGSTISLHFPI